MTLDGTAKSDRKDHTIVFVTFESQFAPLGGLAAVMRALPQAVAQATDDACLMITPFFKHIVRCDSQRLSGIQPTGHKFFVSFDGTDHEVTLLRHVDDEGFTTYLLDAEAFFNAPCDCKRPPSPSAPCNPYVNPDNPDQLLWDALFFSAAVPKALVALGETEKVILHLQDWQTASVALMIKREPQIETSVCTLTLHNPYDRPLGEGDLGKITRDDRAGSTVLEKMLPFLDLPICTVSKNFAMELVKDPLFVDVYTTHLQEIFERHPIVGVDNGAFAVRDFPAEAVGAAQSGDYGPLLQEKQRRRGELVRVLRAYQPEEAWGTLDNLESFEGPIFVMFGRDDPRQKGYDLAAAAIRRVPRGKAKYVFTPIPGEEGLEGLQFLKKLAEERAGEVKVFPFRMAKGYAELIRGSSYLLMSSLYEPFGGATEGYAVGTPVVARATGGLVQQVVPHASRCWGKMVYNRFHALRALPTGFLFREPRLPWDQLVAGWQALVACDYAPGSDRVEARLGIPLFEAMVEAAALTLEDAAELYTYDPKGYAQMILRGFAMLKIFSWDRAAREYLKVYKRL